MQKLIQEQETNTEEIKLFHRNKDLITIPGFFRGIGSVLPLNLGSGWSDMILSKNSPAVETFTDKIRVL